MKHVSNTFIIKIPAEILSSKPFSFSMFAETFPHFEESDYMFYISNTYFVLGIYSTSDQSGKLLFIINDETFSYLVWSNITTACLPVHVMMTAKTTRLSLQA